jgi:DNA-binding GntR family transcriptional regulator
MKRRLQPIWGFPVRRSENDVDEIFELRKAVELAAVEKITRTSPLFNLFEIEESLLKQRKAVNEKDYPAFMEADRLFHTRFSELTNNRRLIAILENLRDMIHKPEEPWRSIWKKAKRRSKNLSFKNKTAFLDPALSPIQSVTHRIRRKKCVFGLLNTGRRSV